jgi:D-3-phosphoglycerate dehydrogenase / 2-oxoglutarate reductase
MSSLPKILITDGIHESAVRILRPLCDVIYEPKLNPEQLLTLIHDVNGLMIRSASTITAQVMEQAPNLKIIGRAGVGTDNIDLATATQRGVVVVNSPEGNTVAASEHTIAMLLAMARHIPQADASMHAGQWQRNAFVGTELFGKTLGVLGLGKIGSRVAKTCLSLGMKVLVYDPFLSPAMAETLGVQPVALDTIWEQADFISIHTPKIKETVHLLNRNTLARCKEGVKIVNCARGGIIDEAALAEALLSGQVGGAAIDVFEQEPPQADCPLLNLPTACANRLIITPHLGASTQEAQLNVALDVAEQMRDFFKEGYASHAVNLPTLRKELLDPVKHYMPMAEVLGNLVRQLAQGPAEAVEITAKGTLAGLNTSPLTLAVLKGILSKAREGVNYVNAPLLAEEYGLKVKAASTKGTDDYLNLLTVSLSVQLSGQKRRFSVAGTLVADSIFRIVAIDDYRLTLEPTPHILLTPHKDQPGMIAGVASILGQNGVNISALQVARSGPQAGGDSVMIFNLDNPASPAALDAIRQLPGIYDAMAISLG